MLNNKRCLTKREESFFFFSDYMKKLILGSELLNLDIVNILNYIIAKMKWNTH